MTTDKKHITLTGPWERFQPGKVFYVLDERERYSGRQSAVDRVRAERLVKTHRATWGEQEIEAQEEAPAAETTETPRRRNRRTTAQAEEE